MPITRRPLTKFDPDLPESARHDTMGPPERNTPCRCLHCDHVFDSDEMVYHRGLWCCPKISCGGAGFLFDIYPTASAFWLEDGDRIEIDEWGVISFPECPSEEDLEMLQRHIDEKQEPGFPAIGL
jgi:hypothetical protein